mmetsp:Transcript_54768/g.168764  ORF Transcript_54768/g.168764 Transcript_54768/m.168764 type:complete len:234 (+) Transcript_54768:580-1281(+)
MRLHFGQHEPRPVPLFQSLARRQEPEEGLRRRLHVALPHRRIVRRERRERLVTQREGLQRRVEKRRVGGHALDARKEAHRLVDQVVLRQACENSGAHLAVRCDVELVLRIGKAPQRHVHLAVHCAHVEEGGETDTRRGHRVPIAVREQAHRHVHQAVGRSIHRREGRGGNHQPLDECWLRRRVPAAHPKVEPQHVLVKRPRVDCNPVLAAQRRVLQRRDGLLAARLFQRLGVT